MTTPDPGTRVRFFDAGAVTSDSDAVVVTEGIVNGPPIEADDRVYIPVYAERDNNREATTIYVDEANLLGIAS